MVKKILKILSVIITAIAICFIGIIVWLWYINKSIENEREYVSISDLPNYCITDASIIREITECTDLPDFQVKELWYYKSDTCHSVPYIECSFNKEMMEEEFMEFCDKLKNVCWDYDKDGTLLFSRGWSKKEYMEVPKGMDENLVIEIDKLSQQGFTLLYKRNVRSEIIDKDFINNLTGHVFPPFSVISYKNDGETVMAKLLFSNLVEKKIADALSNGLDSMEIKVDTLVGNKWIFFDMLRNEKQADLLIVNK